MTFNDLVFIVILQLIYVPLLTLRTIFVVKGNTGLAVPLGFVESMVHILGISIILSGDQNYIKILVYCTGYALGILVGTKIEKKLAVGFRSVKIIIDSDKTKLVNILRESGFGVTSYDSVGKNGAKTTLDVLSKRSEINKLKTLTLEAEPSAFLSVSEIIEFNGGHLLKRGPKRTRSKEGLKNKTS